MRSVAEGAQQGLLDVEYSIDEIGDRCCVGVAHTLVFQRTRDQRRDVHLIAQVQLFELAEQAVESMQADARAVMSK